MIKNNTILCHERLAVVGVDSGAQPLIHESKEITLAVNGEIYNHRDLRKKLKRKHNFQTRSDCEVILYLYDELDLECANVLDGFFSFVLHDTRNGRDRVIAARDPIGITTLYQGFDSKSPETVYFASELKCLHPVCDKIISFPPGHIYDSETGKTTRYFKPTWLVNPTTPTNPADLNLIRKTLEKAVRKRLMSEVPYGVLLSGGLDSSLIASIAARETERVAKAQAKLSATPNGSVTNLPSFINEYSGEVGITSDEDRDDSAALAAWPRLHSFSIGLPGSPDLLAARAVAKFLGTVHHEHTFTVEEGLDAVQDVIYHLETYDVTTIRASTPMYLLSRKIKAQGVKMVLSGEGSDEIFGGYLYFHKAPNGAEFHRECVERVSNLHLSDCLRANKSTLAWGLEARVPFLDKSFLQVCMNIDPTEKMITKEKMEKYILRKAFDTTHDKSLRPYLPHNILWRQKEQFSDGVGYSWIDALKDKADAEISDDQLASPRLEWGSDSPDSKEAYLYRCMFDSKIPYANALLT